MTSPIPLSRPATDEAEVEAVRAVLESGWLAGQGPQGAVLERLFAGLAGRRHAIAVNNCTAGLHLVLTALGVGPGDEVVVPDYTFPATAHAVMFCGATPVLVDVRAATATLDPAALREAVTGRTKAVIGVDALGMPADWDELAAIADAAGVPLIEDAACSAGGLYRDRPCGSFGVAAVFSLHARKGITSGEGGVIVTDDDDVAEAVRLASCFGMRSAFARQSHASLEVPEFGSLGYNYKLSDVLAAIGVAQFDKLEPFTQERQQLADRYRQLFDDVDGVTTPGVPPDRMSTWQTYALTVEPDVDRNRAAVLARDGGVGANIGTYSLACQPVYGADARTCPVSGDLFARHLAIPMFNGLTAAEQERVAQVVGSAVARSRR